MFSSDKKFGVFVLSPNKYVEKSCIMVAEEIFEDISICRICLEEGSSKKLIKPCGCRGSMGGVHITCLENWLNVKNIRNCEICDDEYKIERILKYGRISSIVPYLRSHRLRTIKYAVCISLIFLLTMFANFVISYVQDKLSNTSYDFFVKVYFFVLWLFVNYFFFIEILFDFYNLWVSWQTWRASVFTIRIR